ncbi:MAG TPA: sigma-70 family RNA polymerase sigma factor [Chthoniobacteraceae bacterium]|nr:sigma-70 family RNA polymerase sigma factor [Chthoniobacteraceae bacterium]
MILTQETIESLNEETADHGKAAKDRLSVNHAAAHRNGVRESEEISDETLMTRVSQHDASALEELFDRHAGVIKSVIFRIIHNEAEAEDVLMEVFNEAWKGASKYSAQKGKALGWLVTMARRRGIDRLRKRQSYSRATDRLQVEVEHDPEAWISGRDPDGDSERADLRQFIQLKLFELPPFQREAIEYAFYKGMSQREIAAHTGIPLGTIKTRIELGLKKLSVSLEVLEGEWV